MFKNKEQQKQAQKDWVRQKRAKGSTKQGMVEGSTKEVVAKGSTGSNKRQGSTATKGTKNTGLRPIYNKELIDLQRHLAETVTGPKRKKIQMIVNAFAESHHPEYAQEIRYGLNGPTMDVMSMLLDITK